MFKLITKRGKIEFKFLTTGLPTFLKIDTLDNAPIWYFNHDDLERNDAVILVGYMGTDEHNDPILYVCAYFNISKSKRSSTKPQAFRWFLGSILAILLTVIYWFYSNNFVITILLAIIELITLFASSYSLIAYQILEKEIKKLL